VSAGANRGIVSGIRSTSLAGVRMSPFLVRCIVAAGPLVALSAVAALTASAPTAAEGRDACGARLDGAFVESAPRDRFEFTNASRPGWTVAGLTLDLDGSAGRLVFDTAPGGQGVEVFQPFRTESGVVRVADVRAPDDGGETLALEFVATTRNASEGDAGADAGVFDAGATYVFSIDVDDRLRESDLGQIRVSGSEIAGGRLSARIVHESGVVERLDGPFDATARVELLGTPCP